MPRITTADIELICYSPPRPLPARPTDAPPGSEAKIAVMTQRHDRGQQLHHPHDNSEMGAGMMLRRWSTWEMLVERV